MFYGWCKILFFVWVKMDVRDQFCINYRSKKGSSANEKEIEKSTTSAKSLNEYLFEKRNERKNHKATWKTISADKRKSISLGNFKTVDGSVTIEIWIMDTSKESLEAVRRSKLQSKLGKVWWLTKIGVSNHLPPPSASKKRAIIKQITISFFPGWKTTYFFYPDTKLVYMVQISHLLLLNIKKGLFYIQTVFKNMFLIL